MADDLSPERTEPEPSLTAGPIEPPPPRPRSRVLPLAAGAAILFHAGLIGIAVLGDRLDRGDLQDEIIPVEVVNDMPKPPKRLDVPWPEAPDDLDKAQKPRPEATKPDPPKPEAPKPEPQKPDSKKPEPARQESPKADAPKPPEPTKPAEPKPPEPSKAPALQQQAPKAEAEKPPPPAPAPPAGAAPPPPAGEAPPPAGDPKPEADAKPPPAAFAEPPKPVLRTKEEIYAPLTFELMPGTFRDRALTTAGQKEADDYKADIFELLERTKQIPESARARNASGTAVVAFSIDLDGRLLNASIARSSGAADLDAAALATVERAAPFPLPPPQAQRSFAAAILFGGE